MVSMNITRKYNRVGIFCEAVRGGLEENATTSNELNFDVMCKLFYINEYSFRNLHYLGADHLTSSFWTFIYF